MNDGVSFLQFLGLALKIIKTDLQKNKEINPMCSTTLKKNTQALVSRE